MRVVRGDILTLDPALLLSVPEGALGQPLWGRRLLHYHAVANLPYYVTNAVVRHLLEARVRPFQMVLTVQRGGAADGGAAGRDELAGSQRAVLRVSPSFACGCDEGPSTRRPRWSRPSFGSGPTRNRPLRWQMLGSSFASLEPALPSAGSSFGTSLSADLGAGSGSRFGGAAQSGY